MSKFVKGLAQKLIQSGHLSTSIFDRRFLNQPIECQWPPVFILGAPRSGTTLLYQLMVNSFKFSYFPNIADLFYMCPISATQIGLRFCLSYTTNFDSEYGFEKGCLAPSEAGNIWNRWFPQEKRDGFNYTPSGYLSSKTQSEIYRVLANFEALFEAPFINKNVKTNVRLAAIKEIFPKALFIRIFRNHLDTALSLLLYRRKNSLAWFSVMPKEISRIKQLSDIEQVCHQVFYLEQNVNNDIKLFDSENIHSLQYADLCKKTTEEMEKIYTFLNSNGCLSKKREGQPSLPFHESKPKIRNWISNDEIQRMEEILKSMYAS